MLKVTLGKLKMPRVKQSKAWTDPHCFLTVTNLVVLEVLFIFINLHRVPEIMSRVDVHSPNIQGVGILVALFVVSQ